MGTVLAREWGRVCSCDMPVANGLLTVLLLLSTRRTWLWVHNMVKGTAVEMLRLGEIEWNNLEC